MAPPELETQRLRLQNLQLTQQLAESQAKLAVTEDRVSQAETNSTNTPRPGGGGPRRQMAFASSGGGASGAKVQSVSPSSIKPPRQKAATKPKGKAKKDMSGRQEATVDDAEAELGLALGTYGKVFKSNAFTESMALRAEVITGLGGKLTDMLRKLGRGKEDFGETDHRLNLLKTLAAEVIDGDEEMGFELAAFLVGSGSETWKCGKQKPRLCDHVYAQQRHPVNRISGASAILRKCLNGCLRPSDMAEVCPCFDKRFFFRVHFCCYPLTLTWCRTWYRRHEDRSCSPPQGLP